MTYSWQNEAGEPIMDGAAWRFEQSLDMERPYEPDDYLRDDYEDDEEGDEEDLGILTHGQLVHVSRAVRLAPADVIRVAFGSEIIWGDPHSGAFLTKALLGHHAPEKPALGVANAILLSFVDYVTAFPGGGAAATFMRIPQAVGIMVPDPGEAALVQAILNELQGI